MYFPSRSGPEDLDYAGAVSFEAGCAAFGKGSDALFGPNQCHLQNMVPFSGD